MALMGIIESCSTINLQLKLESAKPKKNKSPFPGGAPERTVLLALF